MDGIFDRGYTDVGVGDGGAWWKWYHNKASRTHMGKGLIEITVIVVMLVVLVVVLVMMMVVAVAVLPRRPQLRVGSSYFASGVRTGSCTIDSCG